MMKGNFWIAAAAAVWIGLFGVAVATAGQSGGGRNPENPKAVFDFRIGKPEAAQLMLQLIHKTYTNLSEEKRNPDFVVVFVSSSVTLISTDTSGFSEQEKKVLQKIGTAISRMKKDGIVFEGSELAAYFAGIEPKTFLPEIQRVDNGLVSIIDYQASSYSLVPIY